MEQIPKPIKINFVGGFIKLTPGGEFKSKDGTIVQYVDNVKMVGSGRYPIKLTRSMIRAIITAYEQHPEFIEGLMDE